MDKIQMAVRFAEIMLIEHFKGNGVYNSYGYKDGICEDAWVMADAMQAEADKRNKSEAEEKRKQMRELLNAENTFIEKEGQHFDDVTKSIENHECNYVYGRVCSCGKVKEESNKQKCAEKIEINMYPEWDATINYPPDAQVMYRGEKRLAVSIKEEWQLDWSQAPDGFNYFCVGSEGGYGFFSKQEPKLCGSYYFVGNDGFVCKNHSYQGNWQESLRKRPHDL